MQGVFAVYTAHDLDDLVEPVRAPSRMQNYHATELFSLARDKVRYVGEPVVAVLGENRYLAEDAIARVEIAYDLLETVIDPEIAVRKNAPLLHEEAGTNVLAERVFARGDVEAEMAVAPVRFGGRFRFHRKTPVAIENRACLAEYDRGDRSLTLTSSTQIPGIIRDLLADLLQVSRHVSRGDLAQDRLLVAGGLPDRQLGGQFPSPRRQPTCWRCCGPGSTPTSAPTSFAAATSIKYWVRSPPMRP